MLDTGCWMLDKYQRSILVLYPVSRIPHHYRAPKTEAKKRINPTNRIEE
jgi:hypothetical protein